MRHFTEDEMIAYELKESDEAEAIREHLGGCSACAELDRSVAETLEEFADVPVPAAEFERSWQQVRVQLDAPVRRMAMMEEESIFRSLWSSVREALFPVKLPPLVLESTPVAVIDRMAVKRDPRGLVWAVVIEGITIMLIGYAVMATTGSKPPVTKVEQVVVPPPAPLRSEKMGGGGGQKSMAPVAKGNLPKLIAPPVPKIETPKILTPPTIDVQADLKMPALPLPNFGDPRSPIVGAGTGLGSGNGYGSGTGGGVGDGMYGNIGGGVRRVGGRVSEPVLTTKVDPEFSEEARKAKFSGNVLVTLIVDEHGLPQNVRVLQGVGMGLDEKAVEAVKQYRFRPAREDGKPVPVVLNIEVQFTVL